MGLADRMTYQKVVLWLAAMLAGALALCPYDQSGLEAWSDPSTWGGTLPQAGDNVVLPAGKKVLLDTSPPALGSLTIGAGTALVWADKDDLTVSADFILVLGRFDIGSQNCSFTKRAKIRLTGTVKSANIGKLGGSADTKFLGVGEGGTLELHGAPKKGWTKLVETVPAASLTCGIISDLQTGPYASETASGLFVAVWMANGTVLDFGVFPSGDSFRSTVIQELLLFLEGIPEGSVVGVAVHKDLGTDLHPDWDWQALYGALEDVAHMQTNTSLVRRLASKQAYALLTVKGDPSQTQETLGAWKGADAAYSETPVLRLTLQEQEVTFAVQSTVPSASSGGSGPSRVLLRSLTSALAFPVIKVRDDVSSWKAGDEVLVTSTDFDWRQAEIRRVVACDGCSNTQLRLEGEFENMHFGDITRGVDERAEVALLTRNIRIEGVMEDRCHHVNDVQKEACDRLGDIDSNGGHVKAVLGFEDVHIEGVELVHMGSGFKVGRYPLHFHMCDDADGAWLRNNSIHHTFARCVTIHGTDGVEVSDNVCWDHHGHGYFLEDSAEQRNVLEGNLGGGSRFGLHLMSDRPPSWCPPDQSTFCGDISTYWLTHPNNHIRNNVAAGSDAHGYMYAFAQFPLGPSRQRQLVRGLVGEGTARMTPITEFSGNVAHSNKRTGLFLDNTISHGFTDPDLGFIPENGVVLISRWCHDPRLPPYGVGDRTSSLITGFTAYKNQHQGLWLKGGNINVRHSTFADSPRGLTNSVVFRNVTQHVDDCLFVGETDNKGMPATVKVDGQKFTLDRSLPNKKPDKEFAGLMMYQGSKYMNNNYFESFQDWTWAEGHVRRSSAISFKRGNPYPSDPDNSVSKCYFAFCDESQGTYLYSGDPGVQGWGDGDGVRASNFRDVDGTLTGRAGIQLVRPHPFFLSPACRVKPRWNMALCPHQYARVTFLGKDGVLEVKKTDTYPLVLYRDDVPDSPFSLRGDEGAPYLVMKRRSYLVEFNGTSPTQVSVEAGRLEEGDWVRLGLCFPKDSKFSVSWRLPRANRKLSPTWADSVDDVDSDSSGRVFFWDKERGLLFFKLISNDSRQYEEMCTNFDCPTLTIRRNGSTERADCKDEAYGPYKKAYEATEQPPDLNPPCVTSVRGNQGAPVEASPKSEFNVPCPALPEPRAYRAAGCFKESVNHPDVPVDTLQFLPRSMTPQLCVDRCAMKNYVYAALRSGSECRCTDTVGVYGQDSSRCFVPCSGNKNLTCGSKLGNEVFYTGIEKEATADSSCGPGSKGVVIDGTCFLLSQEKQTLEGSQRACVALGGTLATIASQNVMDSVVKYMRANSVTEDVWFGLHSATKDGSFRFMDGTLLGDFTYWRDAVPKTKAKDIGVYLDAETLFKWRACVPKRKVRYLCQLNSGVEVTACGASGQGQRVGNSSQCYQLLLSPMSWTYASVACHALGGVLSPYTQDSSQALDILHLIFLSGAEMDFWTAENGRRKNRYIELSQNALFTPLEQSTPNKNGAACLLDPASPVKACPTGWREFDGSCYLYTGLRLRKAEDAQSLCNGPMGSGVLSVLSAKEANFTMSLALENNSGKSENLILGLEWSTKTESYQWWDGSPLNFQAWRSGFGQARLSPGGHCATMAVKSAGTAEWRNARCSMLSSILVCKQPARRP